MDDYGLSETYHRVMRAGLLPDALVLANDIEKRVLVGMEGCLWPVEFMRAAIHETTGTLSPPLLTRPVTEPPETSSGRHVENAIGNLSLGAEIPGGEVDRGD
jgi:hypothetical protein